MAGRGGSCEAWTPPNKRKHATADTTALMLRQRDLAARDARRYAASLMTRIGPADLMGFR